MPKQNEENSINSELRTLNQVNRQVKYSILTTSGETYRGYSINTGRNRDLPCNEMTLNQFIDRQEYMTKNTQEFLLYVWTYAHLSEAQFTFEKKCQESLKQ